VEKETVVLDSGVFDRLIELSADQLSIILGRYRLATTDVNMMELERIPPSEKRDKVLRLAKSCEIIGAKIFGLRSYSDETVEDSLGGFASMASDVPGGRFLCYEDGDVLKAIGIEQRKIPRGRAGNDAAIALAIVHAKGTGVIEDRKLRNRLRGLGKRVISFDEFLKEALGAP